jgi:hypothetical protein
MAAFHAAVAPHLRNGPQFGESAHEDHGGPAIRTLDSLQGRASLSVCNHLPKMDRLRQTMILPQIAKIAKNDVGERACEERETFCQGSSHYRYDFLA